MNHSPAAWMALAVLSLPTLAPTALAQFKDNQEKTLACQEGRQDSRYERHCEVKETPLPATGVLDIDASPNGGVAVKGWSRTDILVRAKIETRAATGAQAKDLAARVRLEASAGRIRSDGPKQEKDANWSVSYEIFVPFRTDITAKSVNGGIRLSDLNGRIDCSAVNGGLSLARLAGNVHGQTVNGGLNVELDGQRWEGEGLDLRSTNGGVKLEVPAGYSARLETGTVNGSLDVDYPATVRGKISKEAVLELGSGGTALKVHTTNGGVRVKTKS